MGIPFAGPAGELLLEQVVSSEIGHRNLRYNQGKMSLKFEKFWKARNKTSQSDPDPDLSDFAI